MALLSGVSSIAWAVVSSPAKALVAANAFSKDIGVRVADMLVPSPPAQAPEPAAPAPLAVAAAKATTKAAPKKATPSKPKSVIRKSPIKVHVKAEPTRSTRHRNAKHSCGFYSESNLAAMAWSGTGSKADPIQFS